MRELLLTNNPVLLSYVQSLLSDQGIATVVFDQHISIMEGGIAAFPRRLMVEADHWARAVRVMHDADLAEWIKDDGDA